MNNTNLPIKLFLVLGIIFLFSGCAVFKKDTKKTKQELLLVKTNYGEFTLRLFDETPEHKNNFLKLVDSSYFDSVLFHRVIKDFMIQGGDPDSKGAKSGIKLGEGGPNYTLPAEFRDGLIHKKGVLAAAREGDDINPEKRSSGSQFYIVTGRRFSKQNLLTMSDNINHSKKIKFLKEYLNQEAYQSTLDSIRVWYKSKQIAKYDSVVNSFNPITEKYLDSVGRHSFTEDQLLAYSTVGGAPHLDGSYTVFGEVVSGMEVIELISMQKVDPYNRPISDVIILEVKRVKVKIK
jgi:cyclophilin family peptidyl-prolyl cis-trans isomerase